MPNLPNNGINNFPWHPTAVYTIPTQNQPMPDPWDVDWDGDEDPLEDTGQGYGDFLKYLEKEYSETHNVPMNITKTKLSKIIKYRGGNPIAEGTVKASHESLRTLFNLYEEELPVFKLPKIEKEPDALIGIEIELENYNFHCKNPTLNNNSGVYDQACVYLGNVWNRHADSSLRNNGTEFITRFGVKAGEAPEALLQLREFLEVMFTKVQLTYRCGTHVHVNVRDFTVEQLINMTFLYILFEDLFYKVSGERYKNPFCVPISASASTIEKLVRLVHLAKPTYKDFRESFKTFKKYMAFNLRPAGLYDQDKNFPLGSVEFRHHKGSSHPVALSFWLQYIIDIHHYAQQVSFEELKDRIFNLNSNSMYYQFASTVFTRLPDRYTMDKLASDMYEGSGLLKEIYLTSKGL